VVPGVIFGRFKTRAIGPQFVETAAGVVLRVFEQGGRGRIAFAFPFVSTRRWGLVAATSAWQYGALKFPVITSISAISTWRSGVTCRNKRMALAGIGVVFNTATASSQMPRKRLRFWRIFWMSTLSERAARSSLTPSSSDCNNMKCA
jgi:hypothetical protein